MPVTPNLPRGVQPKIRPGVKTYVRPQQPRQKRSKWEYLQLQNLGLIDDIQNLGLKDIKDMVGMLDKIDLGINFSPNVSIDYAPQVSINYDPYVKINFDPRVDFGSHKD